MNLICPLCNGLMEVKDVKCEFCNNVMVDKGRLTDYLDDYSPYLEMNITELVDGGPNNVCVHLFKCEKCNTDKRIAIDKIIQ